MSKHARLWVFLAVLLFLSGPTRPSDLESKRAHAAIVAAGWSHLEAGELNTAKAYFEIAVALDPEEPMGNAGLYAIRRVTEPGDWQARIVRLQGDYRTVQRSLLDSARGGATSEDYFRAYRYSEMYLLFPKAGDNPRWFKEALSLREMAKRKLGLPS